MKKQISILLSLFVAFSLLFVSCNDNDDMVCKITVKSDDNGKVSISNYIGTSANVLVGNIVEVVAVPSNKFIGWFVGDAEVPISTEATYTFTVNEDIALVAKFKNPYIATGSENGYDYVDLGLSVKWATCNVGATSPEEFGGYYAWGETEEKENYSWSTYKYCNGSSDSMTKYCTNSDYGTVDNKTDLDPEDDVATLKWGGDWRMPTLAEQQELIDECTWTWTTLNGVDGNRVTGPNGNSIFLPAAGYRDDTDTDFVGEGGFCWSGSLSSNRSGSSCYLCSGNGIYDWSYYGRSNGLCVRPVVNKTKTSL